MKRYKAYFGVLFLMTLLTMTSCTPPENIRHEEPIISEVPESSLDSSSSSSAAEPPGADRAPSESAVKDDKDFDDGSVNLETVNDTNQEILVTVGEGNYVIHGSLSDTEHMELLDEWIACFQTGTPAQPLYLLHEGVWTSNELRLLEYQGGSHYTVTDCVSGKSWESAVIVRRAADYVFGSDLPRDDYAAKAATCIVRHTPYSAEPLAYDLESTPALGSVPAEDACELAIILNSNWPAYNREEPVDGTTVATVTGAVQLMGTPCYRVTVEWEMVNGSPAGNDLAVSADGRLIYSDYKMVGEGWYSLVVDYGEQYLVAAH